MGDSVANWKRYWNMRIIILVFLVGLSAPAAAQRPQVIPEPMLANLFALTEAAATLQICAQSGAYASVSGTNKKLLQRLQKRIDGMIKLMAVKFDDDLFGFFEVERNKAAREPVQIEQVRSKYGPCGDALFKRMRWYVYDSRQKLELFLSELPDAK